MRAYGFTLFIFHLDAGQSAKRDFDTFTANLKPCVYGIVSDSFYFDDQRRACFAEHYCVSSSNSAKIRSQRFRTARPAGVRSMPEGLRSKSSSPCADSNSCTKRVTADWARKSVARVALPVSATAGTRAVATG
jgi:hypothetical protein